MIKHEIALLILLRDFGGIAEAYIPQLYIDINFIMFIFFNVNIIKVNIICNLSIFNNLINKNIK